MGKDFCLQYSQQCTECSKRGCNDNSLKWAKALSCVKCKSDKKNNCIVISDELKAIECTPIAEGYNNECFTYVRDGAVERGCLYEASADIRIECGKHLSESCKLCDKSDCNRAKVLIDDSGVDQSNRVASQDSMKQKASNEQFCYHCDSRTHPNCAFELTTEMLKSCPNSEQNLGCYHMKTGW